jgi:hypothetical protein
MICASNTVYRTRNFPGSGWSPWLGRLHFVPNVAAAPGFTASAFVTFQLDMPFYTHSTYSMFLTLVSNMYPNFILFAFVFCVIGELVYFNPLDEPPANITGKIAYGIALGDIPGYMRYTEILGAIGLLLFDPLSRSFFSYSTFLVRRIPQLTQDEMQHTLRMIL